MNAGAGDGDKFVVLPGGISKNVTLATLQANAMIFELDTGNGVTMGNVAVDISAAATPEDIAQAIADTLTTAGIPATQAMLSDSSGFLTPTNIVNLDLTAGTNSFYRGGGFSGTLRTSSNFTTETYTGMTVVNKTFYVVSDAGGLYTMAVGDSAATLTAVDTATDLTGIDFQGVTTGPPNVEGGIYEDMLFAVDSKGVMYAFDTTGKLQPVFLDGNSSVQLTDNNNNPLGDATHLVHGISFSNLDTNLFHTTLDRRDNPGHENIPGDRDQRLSLAFTNERENPDVIDNTNPTNSTYGFLAGGAHGTVETDPFSLVGYSAADQPTLYYNYFLDTENSSRDVARVYVAGQDGVWTRLIANTDAMFDNTSSWRQARINLSAFAGQSNLRLRFEFSTAGTLNIGNIQTGGTELRALNGDTLRDGDTFTISRDATGITTRTFEFDLGFTVVFPGGSQLNDGDLVTVQTPDGNVVFEFDSNGTFDSNNERVAFTATDSANAIATAFREAVANANFGITAIQNGQRVNLVDKTGAIGTAPIDETPFPFTHNSMATAQDLEGENFTLDTDQNIANSTVIPHLSINGTGDGNIDFYSFHVDQEETGTFNVRNRNFTAELSLYGYDSAGMPMLLMSGGSTLQYTFAREGTYFIAVARTGNNRLQFGDNYTLDVSIENHHYANTGSQDVNKVLVTRVGSTNNGPGILVEGNDGLNNPNNVQLLVDASMTDQEVADVMRRAIAMDLLNTPVPLETIKAYKEVIQVIGHTVTDRGRLGLTKSLPDGNAVNTFPFDPQPSISLSSPPAFYSNLRGQNNDHEGFYFDDIIIGFAERGEISTSAPTSAALGGNVVTVSPSTGGSDIDTGNYQLEIRRGTDYTIGSNPTGDQYKAHLLDTNDLLTNGLTIKVPDGEQIFDGQKFQLSDGVHTVIFEFEDRELNVGDDHFGIDPTSDFAVEFRSFESANVIASRLRDLFNSTAVRNRLDITAALADGTVTGENNAGHSSEVNVFGNIVSSVSGTLNPRDLSLDRNNTLESAQSLETVGFNLTFDPIINDKNNKNTSKVIPHTTIDALGDGALDYYSFMANEGDTVIIDVDKTNFDSEIILFDEYGNLVQLDDDSFRDSGSSSTQDAFLQGRIPPTSPKSNPFFPSPSRTLDSFLQVTIPWTGKYVIRVGQFSGNRGIVPEVETNNSLGSAQNVDDSGFSLLRNDTINNSSGSLFQGGVRISESYPHVTVQGTGDGTFDYYSFTVQAGETGIFDIDGTFNANNPGQNIDTELFLYDPRTGTVLAGPRGVPSADNLGFADPGSFNPNSGTPNPNDPFIQYFFAEAGTYVIGVSRSGSTGNPGSIAGFPLIDGDRYNLNIVIQGHVTDTKPINQGQYYTLNVSVDNHEVGGGRTDDFNVVGKGNDLGVVGNLEFQSFADLNMQFVNLGDQNVERLQGSVQISQNKITDSATTGILVQEPNRRTGNQLVGGSVRSLPTVNSERLTRGVKISNNVIAGFGDAGIDLEGDGANGSVPQSAVPFHRIINNTIYGGATQTGTGIRIDNSSPTLINNIVANTQTAIDLVGAVAQTTVVSHGLYQNNGANDIDGISAINYPAIDQLFVDPKTNNFYLAAPPDSSTSGAIDSARDGFEDRPEIVQVANSIGIPLSNLIAPDFDRFGQQRIDDPRIQNTGQGDKVFFDRGAVERVDFSGPTSGIIAPQDATVKPATVDPNKDLDFQANSVRLVNQTVRQFIIGLDDIGIGIDDMSVFQDVNGDGIDELGNVALLRRPHGGTDYQRLQDQNQYLLRYNTNTKQLTFDAASGVFPTGDYLIVLNSGQPISLVGGQLTTDDTVQGFGAGLLFPDTNPIIRDLAGNSLLANRSDGTTVFSIELDPPPELTINNVTILEGNTGDFTVLNDASAQFFEVTLSADVGQVVSVDYAVEEAPGPDAATRKSVSLATAQNIDNARFGLDSNPNIGSSTTIPHLTIDGTGDGTFDYYSFTVGDGANATFDIDGANFDTELFLYDSNGDLLAENDNFSPTDPGSTSTSDAQLTHSFLTGGTYIIGVGRFDSTGDPGGITGTPPQTGDTYTLQVSLEGHATLPGPSTYTEQADFTSTITNGTLVFDTTDPNNQIVTNPDGSLTLKIPVNPDNITIIGDDMAERSEQFFVRLFNPVNANISDDLGVGTIIDDDLKLGVSDAQIVEGDNGQKNMIFTATLLGADGTSITDPGNLPAFDVTFDYTTTEDTATADVDYVTTSGSVTIPAGQSSATFAVPIIGDLMQEAASEQFFVDLSGANGAAFVNPSDPEGSGLTMLQVTGTILDDDPKFSVTNAVVLEGDTPDTKDVTFTVTASATPLPLSSAVTIDYHTKDLTAKAEGDYNSVFGTLTFRPIDSNQNVDQAGFSLASDPEIQSSTLIPHISIDGTGDGTFDYYSFTVNSPPLNSSLHGTFDIDRANFNGELFLYDMNGNLLDSNDDSPADTGDGSSTDQPRINFDFMNAGTYVIGVGRFDSTGSPNGITGRALQSGDTYRLQVSLEDHVLGSGPTVITETAPDPLSKTVTVTVNADDLPEDNEQFALVLENPSQGEVNTINEIEPNETNNSILTAQNVDNAPFGLDNNVNIINSTTVPHLSIDGTGDGTFDYYSFTAGAGDKATFDIDAANFDTEVFLYDLSGTLLASNDTAASLDNGSTSTQDAFLQYTFATADTYVIKVGGVDQTGASVAPQTGESYRLQLSIENHATAAAGVSTISEIDSPQNVDGAAFGLGANADILNAIKFSHLSIKGLGDGTFDNYSFTVNAGDRVIFDIDQANFDTELFVYDLQGNLVFENDDAAAADAGDSLGGESFLNEVFSAGGTYIVTVGKKDSVGTQGGATGMAPEAGDAYTLNLSIEGHALNEGVATIIDDDPRITISDAGTITEGNSGTTTATFTVSLSQSSPNPVIVHYNTSLGNTPPPLGSYFETEPNDSLQAPEVLDPAAFTVNPAANITDKNGVDTSTTIPHLTIAGRGDGSFDYFSFDAAAGDRVLFDIDGATFDSQLFLYDSAGNLVASNDDGFPFGGPNGDALDDGSVSTEDAFLDLILAADDTYTLAVGRFDSQDGPNPGDGLTGQPLDNGDQYTLHVSIDNFLPVLGSVDEVEPNNTIAAGQNVDNAGFTLAQNDNIDDRGDTDVSTMFPHITINGTGDGTFDYYRFTVTGTGRTGIFDIDGASFDTELFLFNNTGTLLASNDDNANNNNIDDGSLSSLDSFIQFTFAPGTYIIGVGQYDSNGVQGGIQGAAPPVGGTYTLNVTIEGHSLSTPPPPPGGPFVPDGTADPNVDFTAKFGKVTFAPGQTSQDITVDILGDLTNESDENFFVRLSDATGAVIEDGVGEAVIENDDAPIITISDPAPTPETGPQGIPNTINFTVSLSRPADVVTTIDYSTANGTALSGQDYIATSGQLTFQIGEQSKTITVQLIKDGILGEPNETFFVNLSNPVGAEFDAVNPDDHSTGTIIDSTGFVEHVLAIVAPGPGRVGLVKVLDSSDGHVRFAITPYGQFQGGVRVATGNINNDGTPDIITVPGPGGGPQVKVFSGVDGSLLVQFMAYDPNFTAGLYVASGDFAEAGLSQGDSFDDIIVAPDAGGGPHVKVFSPATGAFNNRVFTPAGIENRLLFNFFAYDPNFTGGVRVAAGDVNGDGTDDLVTAVGPGGGPHVKVFNGRTRSTTPFQSFFAYDPRFTGGVYIAVGNIDNSTGAAEIITGPGAGGGPHIKVFRAQANVVLVSQFFAYDPRFTGGVRVATGDVNGDTFMDIITAPGQGGGPRVRVFDGPDTATVGNFTRTPRVLKDFDAYESTFTGGVFVAGVSGQSGQRSGPPKSKPPTAKPRPSPNRMWMPRSRRRWIVCEKPARRRRTSAISIRSVSPWRISAAICWAMPPRAGLCWT